MFAVPACPYTAAMSKQTNCPWELDILQNRRPKGTTGILARLQQELSAARSRNAAAEFSAPPSAV